MPGQDDISIGFPFIIIRDIPFSIDIEIINPEIARELEGKELSLVIDGQQEKATSCLHYQRHPALRHSQQDALLSCNDQCTRQ